MSEKISDVEWNGEALVAWIPIKGVQIRVEVDRDTIHRHAPGFSDALTWEIERHGVEILEKMMPFFRANLQGKTRSTIGPMEHHCFRNARYESK
ncbi:hypothetical protein AAE026_29275 [Bradyrhizobium sp. DN5]|uniref:hypothetical protein n=1 Tax=Bradyrhizobium sp. DN5 TaxID=3056950 RepID=UPI00352353BD